MYIYFLLLLCNAMISCISVKTDQQLINDAHEKILKSDWAGALKDYQAISYKNSSILQNIAYCYVNQGKYADALVYLKRSYFDIGIKNLSSLCKKEQHVYNLLKKQTPFYGYFFLKTYILAIPLWLIQLIFIVILFLILLVLLRCWRWQKFRKSELIYLFKLSLCLIVCMILWYVNSLFLDKNSAIVVKQDVLVYAGPEQTFHVFGKLQLGDMVKFIKKQQNMCKIQYHDFRGWVMHDTVKCINKYD